MQENDERLAVLSDELVFANNLDAHLDLTAPTRSMGSRVLLREGELDKAKSGRKLRAFLFNDMLLFTEQSASLGHVVYRWVSALVHSCGTLADARGATTADPTRGVRNAQAADGRQWLCGRVPRREHQGASADGEAGSAVAARDCCCQRRLRRGTRRWS